MSTRLELLKRYLQEEPSDSFLRYALALEFIALNDTKQAYQQLEQLLNDDPDYLAGYYMAGKTAHELGLISDAKNWYAKGIDVARMQKDQKTLNEISEALNLMEDEI